MDSVDPRRLCQIEIRVSDIQKSLSFYEHVLGWHKVPALIHNYYVLEVPEDCPFGISLIPSKKTEHGHCNSLTTLYFECLNPQEILAKVEVWGGRLCRDPGPLPGYGTIKIFQDPDGQRFGLFIKNNP